MEEAVIRIQANYRGILARRAIREKFVDRSLNSVSNSFMTGSIITRVERVIKHVLRDGSKYTGFATKSATNEDERIPEGRGKIKWPNGDKYMGYFKNGQPHGQGTKILAERNTVIEGQFRNGMAYGEGKMTRANAEGIVELHYEGEFQMDLQHGFGQQTDSKGSQYKGQFTKGMRGPNGIYTFGAGCVYEGEFHNDMLNGHGKMI